MLTRSQFTLTFIAEIKQTEDYTKRFDQDSNKIDITKMTIMGRKSKKKKKSIQLQIKTELRLSIFVKES